MASIRSAVLVPVQTDADGRRHLVLIRRAGGSYAHSGQVAFPGGRFEPQCDDSLLHAALREAEEEVGLRATDVQVLGVLPDRRTLTSDYLVTPFVGFVPSPYPFRACAREVGRVFCVPLSVFRNDPEERLDWVVEGRKVCVPCVRTAGEVVWGVTLDIIRDLSASRLI